MEEEAWRWVCDALCCLLSNANTVSLSRFTHLAKPIATFSNETKTSISSNNDTKNNDTKNNDTKRGRRQESTQKGKPNDVCIMLLVWFSQCVGSMDP